MARLADLRYRWVHAPLNRLSPRLHRRVRYLLIHGRPLRLRRPRAFTEKVNWRCLHDRREVLVATCDKLAMKQWAAERGGPDLRIPRTLWSGTDLGELADVDLPDRWVLKPNHRSGLVLFGAGPADVAALRAATRGWLQEYLASVEGEWAYSRARRCFLVEEHLPGDEPPADHKFFTFAGRTRIVVVDGTRFGRHTRTVHTPDWRRLDVELDVPAGPPTPAPPELARMLEVAERLGSPLEFLRVDLYPVGGQVWFGELTPYPGGGYGVVRPWSFDVELGDAWSLPALTPDGRALRAEAGDAPG